ncbi:MAG: choice-of-anchor D domain-containing protein [Ideonella sp.]
MAPIPTFDISATSIGFSAIVGTPNSSTATISNTGTAPLVLSGFTFGGAFSSEYSLAAANTCGVGVSLAPAGSAGSTCTLVVRFSPADVGARPATLAIAHNATGSPRTITLDGVASAAPVGTIDLQGGSGLAFGGVGLGSSAQQTLTVRNVGSAAINITALTIGGTNPADFSRTGSCSAGALAAGSNCTVVVTFLPAALGARSASLSIASDASNASIAANLALSGEGLALAEPVLAPNPLEAFPATPVGSTSAVTRILTISNPRSNPISYTGTLGGGDAGDFTISSESCPTRAIPGGGSCTISLQFRPAAAGSGTTRSALLSLNFAGSGGDTTPTSPRTVAISGLTVATLTPVFSLSATSLAFTAVINTSVTRTAIISNAGSAPLSLAGLGISGDAASDFALDAANACLATSVLTPGNSCNLVIRFIPTRLGARDATLSITHSAVGSPVSLTLRGTGTATPQGRIEFTSFSLAFADTQVGSSTSLTVTAANRGDAVLTLGSIGITGAAASAFERGGSCQAGSVLAIGQECALVITFRPAAAGSNSATLTVDSDASNGAGAVALSGSGTLAAAPQLSLPATLDFGTQTLGGLYPTRSVQLKNTGTASLLLSSIVVDGAAFANANAAACPSSLEPGQTCDVAIRFSPVSADTSYTGSLRVSSNSTGAPNATTLSGRGTSAAVPALVWSSASPELVFGNVSAGSVSSSQTLTLLNQGPGGLVFTLINAVGRDGSAFTVTGGTCRVPLASEVARPLFQGESCTVEIRFAPASAGEKTGSLQVVSTGNFPPAMTLRGTGLAGPSPVLELSLTSLTFESTRVGAQSQPLEVRLSSTGSGVIRVTALDVSGSYVMQNKTCPALPFTLAPGSECAVTVMFTPAAQGTAAGTLTITTDTQSKGFILALNGQAVAQADVSSGGCSLVDGNSLVDPTLWMLVLLAVVALFYRHRSRAARRSDDRSI